MRLLNVRKVRLLNARKMRLLYIYTYVYTHMYIYMCKRNMLREIENGQKVQFLQ